MDMEEAIKGLEQFKADFKPFCGNGADWERFDAGLTMLKKQPEIVRCEDCKWWDKKDESNYGYCHACKHGYHSDHWEIGIYRTYRGDWFCAYGEKRE